VVKSGPIFLVPKTSEAVEKLFGALKLRPFGNERKFDSNKINSLGIQHFGNARRFRLKTGFSGVFQQPPVIFVPSKHTAESASQAAFAIWAWQQDRLGTPIILNFQRAPLQ
jgi:hypothetical protein